MMLNQLYIFILANFLVINNFYIIIDLTHNSILFFRFLSQLFVISFEFDDFSNLLFRLFLISQKKLHLIHLKLII